MPAPDDPVVRATQCHGEHEVSASPGDDEPVFSFGIATTDKAGRDVFAERKRQGGQPPAGRQRWTLRLLERQVALTEGIPPMDHSTIGRVLKRGRLSLT